MGGETVSCCAAIPFSGCAAIPSYLDVSARLVLVSRTRRGRIDLLVKIF